MKKKAPGDALAEVLAFLGMPGRTIAAIIGPDGQPGIRVDGERRFIAHRRCLLRQIGHGSDEGTRVRIAADLADHVVQHAEPPCLPDHLPMR